MLSLRDRILLPFVVMGVIIATVIIYQNYDFSETKNGEVEQNPARQQEALDMGWDSLVKGSEGYVDSVKYDRKTPNEVHIYVSNKWSSMPIHVQEMALGQLTNAAHEVLYAATFVEKDEVVKVVFHDSNGSEIETEYSYYTTTKN